MHGRPSEVPPERGPDGARGLALRSTAKLPVHDAAV
jgi:hypothetical protein